ncbi:amidohydrolase family protein [Colletotrichum musicola]|uniref:Amidohydrolase family protein n=1 Tax=Colletotrichum musicola TaxID=2175873 RepID=A0A8H6JRY1_9PEZI|nr:amidohydrolase family protein [Colletotrichum musicola]
MAPTSELFVNGRIFLHHADVGLESQPSFAESMLVADGKIKAIGTTAELTSQHADVATQDLRGRTVLPGFIDGHMHLLLLGQGLRKLSLDDCTSLDDIRAAIKRFAAENPDVPRIMCKLWTQHVTPNGVDRSMLDDIDPRPIFIDTKDLHSTWCNTAAVKELGIEDMADPVGGKIHRDAEGKATGLLSEAAVLTLVWPHLAQVAPKRHRMDAIKAAVESYNASGYTGLIEMAMDEPAWDAVCSLRAEEPDLPMRIHAYWLIKPSATEKERFRQVDRAIELHAELNKDTSPDLRIVGIKVITDGIIDACTAFLSEPYATAGQPPPFWTAEQLGPVVKRADSAGLQIALHAIGDAAIKMAVDALEANATPGRRHRLEHIEMSSPEDARRLGELGLTASVQPVHADPAILKAWPRLIGPERCKRAFAYREFADHGALLALGSDGPTAPWAPLQNAYVATTRRSARDPGYDVAVNEHFKLGVCEAITAGAYGTAKSVFAEDRVGSLQVGKVADFVVADMDWTPQGLLKGTIQATWFGGRKVWAAPDFA